MPPFPRPTGAGFEPYVWAATVADVAARHRLSPAHVLLFAADEIAELARSLPTTLVCVDEAYYEYGGETAAPAAPELDNLVCVRTLSKAFGLAGLRVGYCVASPRLAAELSARRSPAPIPTSSATLARAALQRAEIEPAPRATTAERARGRAPHIAAGIGAQ